MLPEFGTSDEIASCGFVFRGAWHQTALRPEGWPATEPYVRILILEDDPLIALDLQFTVEGAGHEVVGVCENLSAALNRLGDGFDFALLDIDLPDGKSFGVAARLHEKRIPFAFVSASKAADLPASLRHVPFIAKPYQQAAIINSLRAA